MRIIQKRRGAHRQFALNDLIGLTFIYAIQLTIIFTFLRQSLSTLDVIHAAFLNGIFLAGGIYAIYWVVDSMYADRLIVRLLFVMLFELLTVVCIGVSLWAALSV